MTKMLINKETVGLVLELFKTTQNNLAPSRGAAITYGDGELWDKYEQAIQALDQSTEQEPYCWTWDEFVSGGKWRAEYGWNKPTSKVTNLQPLYTTPPQRTWFELTAGEISKICGDLPQTTNEERDAIEFGFAIETALRKKNNA